MSVSRLERRWFGTRSPDDACAIVMLHHGLGSVSTWKDFPESVNRATGVPVLVYSRFGHGKSPPVAPVAHIGFMHEGAGIELPDILNEEGIDRPILVGHSDGASIAAIYAGTLGRDRTAACVLLAPHVFVEPCTVENARQATHEYELGTLRSRLAAHHDEPDGVFWRWNRSWLESDFLEWNILAEVATIRCSVAVVQGLDDPYGTIAQVDRLGQALPGRVEKVILKDCGHEPHRDHPGVVLDVITQLAKVVRNC